MFENFNSGKDLLVDGLLEEANVNYVEPRKADTVEQETSQKQNQPE